MASDYNHIYTNVHVDETHIGVNNESSDKINCDNNSDETSSNDSVTSGSMEIILRPTENAIESSSRSNANIGSITVQNSTDVTFGNKSFFNGPVVIKKFVVNNSNIQRQCFEISEDAPGIHNLCNVMKSEF